MSDFQTITDAICAFLLAPERSWNDDLPDLAANYAAACRDANNRLRRCQEYLHRGMRSEAIHLADCQPKLIEMAAALRFEQAAEWAQLCSTNGLPIAPPLVEEPAEALEEARALEKDLGPLLSQHRILSLAKAPLPERIEILSALADRDSENPCWRQEIQLLENARLDEIRESAVEAVKNGDSHRIVELLELLKDRSWHGPVPRDLCDELQRAADEAAAAENIAAARNLAAELYSACEQGDFDLATHLQEQWIEMARVIPLAIRNEIRESLEPAIAWIDGEARARNPEVDTQTPIASSPATTSQAPSAGRAISPLILKCVAAGVLLAVVGAYVVMHHLGKHFMP